MRVVFVGSSEFSLKCLDLISSLESIDLVGVITNPSTFAISYSNAPVTNCLHSDLVAWSSERDVCCYQLNTKMNSPHLLEWVLDKAPDLFLVVGWYHLVPQSLRDIAPAIGLHASLLPDYSGGAPLVWAIINGEQKTGITLFKMDSGVDSGPIIGQAEEVILPSDTIRSLYDRIEKKGLQLLVKYLPIISSGKVEYQQQDSARRRIFPQRSPADGLINCRLDAWSIDRFIRAQTKPYPGAYLELNDGSRLTIWEALPVSATYQGLNSSFVSRDSELILPCSSGSLLLKHVTFNGQDFYPDSISAELGPIISDLSINPSQI